MTDSSVLLYVLVALAVVVLTGAGLFIRSRRARGPSAISAPPAPPIAPPARPILPASPPTAPAREQVVDDPAAGPVDQKEAPEAVAPPADVITPPKHRVDDASAVAPEPAVEVVEEPVPEAPVKRGRVRSIGASLKGIFTRSTLTDEDWEDLEEVLLRADVGVAATGEIVAVLKKERVDDAFAALRAELLKILGTPDRSLRRKDGGLTVWLVTGVNGAGKTTTIGKLAARLTKEGAAVVLAAADTFRAAADEQLDRWGQAAGAAVVRGLQGSDPAAVVFDGVKHAKSAAADVLLVDTAGRLQTKRNLMEELGKIKRVLERESGEPDEVLLVLDATTGQNGVQQARAFAEVAGVTGIVLTKLDGTAKGGIVIAVQKELGLPVKLVGLGEGIDDLASFDPESFVDDLLRA